MTRFLSRRVVVPSGILTDCEIVVDGGRFVAIRQMVPNALGGSDKRTASVDPEFDEPWYEYAIPGHIDIHTHGVAGHDLMDIDRSGLDEICRHHLRHGTTSFVASTVTAPISTLRRVIDFVREYLPRNRAQALSGTVATLLGVHLEGPWISPAAAGAQNAVYMGPPDATAGELVQAGADVVRMVTFSYHYPSSPEFLDLLIGLGIVAACGHDETIDAQIVEGFARGLRHITHLYSMTGSFRRVGGYKHVGTLEAALMTPGVAVEVIADGRHVTDYMWRFITHNKSYDDIVIVSDSMRCAGLESTPGLAFRVGDIEVIVEDGVAWLPDRSAFAGSTATMHGMFRRLVRKWGVAIPDAVRMTSSNPARALGVADQIGAIEVGKQADLLLLDADLDIVRVVKEGAVSDPRTNAAVGR